MQTTDANGKKVNVFLSYSHKDEEYLQLMKTTLHPKFCPLLNVWDDSAIPLGGQWNNEIVTQLNNAQIILLLISQDFLLSKYIDNTELKTALERDKQKLCKVIPIFTRTCNLDNFEQITALQGLPKNMHFLSDMGREIDNQLAQIQKDINEIASAFLTDQNIASSIEAADDKSEAAKTIQDLAGKRTIFLSVPDAPEARKKRMEFIIQADAKVKYEAWPYEIVPGIRDVQEIDKLSEEEQIKTFTTLLADSLYSIHIVTSETDLQAGINKLQYDLAKGLHPSSQSSVFRSIVWLLSADLMSKMDKVICQNPVITGNDFGAFFDKIASLDVDKEKEIADRKREFFPSKKLYMFYDFGADHDNDLRIDLKTALEEQNYSLRWNTPDDDGQKETEDLEACEGALVFYGAAQPKWFMVKQARLLDVKNLRSRAICLDEPDIQKKMARDVSKLEFVTIRGKAELTDGVHNFLQRLQP